MFVTHIPLERTPIVIIRQSRPTYPVNPFSGREMLAMSWLGVIQPVYAATLEFGNQMLYNVFKRARGNGVAEICVIIRLGPLARRPGPLHDRYSLKPSISAPSIHDCISSAT